MERVLIVGEHNPHSRDDRHALHPHPPGAAGARLCKILGMAPCEYLETFDRVNLLKTAKWDRKKAHDAAQNLTHARRILLGANVAAAHGLKFLPFERFQLYTFGPRPTTTDVLVLPHPSGRCRIWNDKASTEAARAAVKQFMEGAPR